MNRISAVGRSFSVKIGPVFEKIQTPGVSNASPNNQSVSTMASKCAWSNAPLGILFTIFHSIVFSILSFAKVNGIPGKTSTSFLSLLLEVHD